MPQNTPVEEQTAKRARGQSSPLSSRSHHKYGDAARSASWARVSAPRSGRAGRPGRTGCLQRTNNGPQRLGGTAVATNDLPEIVRVDPDSSTLPATNPAGPHVNVVGILYDPLDEVLKRLFQHVRPRPRTSPRSSRPTSPRPSCTFRPCSRARQDELLQHSLEGGLLSLLVLGLGDLERLGRCGQPFELLPVTGELEDCAPARWAEPPRTTSRHPRSEFDLDAAKGPLSGGTRPISSIARPSRLVRLSATTMRY